ncbi:type II secretion system protein E [Desulfurispirillum indicum S5]|uniref:Type II secretion system protein E n=1 Tax=Desulfurispirillum indicum (strain ATCC BAA-1389 / DSM 22839 / S5) TaxID=653733 RepID=E6W612_DESIS|nr:GspE/PulE family protein [Desulfurispirillum indicum]ADU64951.1 type II secretion system protein E [Desulfurispirillum indicum S5]
MSAPNRKIRIGDLLTEAGYITEEQLGQALEEQKRSGKKLGHVLVESGMVSEDKFLRLLAEKARLPFVELKHYKFREEQTRKLPETLARRFRAIILSERTDGFLIGMADPMDIFAMDEMQRILKRPVFPAVVRESELISSLDSVYRRQEDISSIAEELEDELKGASDFDLTTLMGGGKRNTSELLVVRLLQSILEDAIQAKASDIHIEPDENILRIRHRIDGILHEQTMKKQRIDSALVMRLKIMSGLDISEKRIPQDGRFNIKIRGHMVDVRVSTLPSQYGETVVLRILDQSQGILQLDRIGMPEAILERFRTLIKRPHGMILVTGPTGSGKTTTLYGALSELNTPEVKIITAEDPVEYRLPRITQVQINPKVGLTFARVLRSSLRQDPDILLVGEMRDQETAEIGLRSAMTGHLVLSTLHTNDAISTATRLIDMGAEPFLVATALRGIISQRLIRCICENCKEVDTPSPREKIWIEYLTGKAFDEQTAYFRGKGCHQCNNTGYSGRMGVYELLEMNEPMMDALRRSDGSAFARAAREDSRYCPLALCALDAAQAGKTTIDEVFKVSASLEEHPEPSAEPPSATQSAPSMVPTPHMAELTALKGD